METEAMLGVRDQIGSLRIIKGWGTCDTLTRIFPGEFDE